MGELPPDLVAGYRLAIEDMRDLRRYWTWHHTHRDPRSSLSALETSIAADYLYDQMRYRFEARPR